MNWESIKSKYKGKIPFWAMIVITFIFLIAYGFVFSVLNWWQHILAFVFIVGVTSTTIVNVFEKSNFPTKHKATKQFVGVEFTLFLIGFVTMTSLMETIETQTYQIISSATLAIILLLLVTGLETVYETFILSNEYISQDTYNKSYRKDLRTVKLIGTLLVLYLLCANLFILSFNLYKQNLWDSYETIDSDKSHIEVKTDIKGQPYIDKSETTFYLKNGEKVEYK
ncbi:hypothetical protein [Staphylococcus equorum]|uniref:hypothetical protein n=1 Tax=Staphylococcus equorum TaxID=246432 RepID=UPI00085393EB|nr:hypothetical protein [Staphylococcus equorum]OEL08275.1 hypothetical protein AST04_08805 [Staphylococcus equorum]